MSDQDNKPQVIDVPSVPTQTDPRDLLPPEERDLLAHYEETVLSQDPARTLAASTASKFFQLFLNGYSPREIQALNPSFPLGMIIHARVKFRWDEERDKHIKEMLERVREKVMCTQLESMHFLTDVLSAMHKLYGNKVKKFLQTGNEEDLKGAELGVLFNYTKAFDLVAKLTGNDKDRKGAVAPVNVFLPPAQQTLSTPDKPALPLSTTKVDRLLSPDDAAKVVRALLEIKKVRDGNG